MFVIFLLNRGFKMQVSLAWSVLEAIVLCLGLKKNYEQDQDVEFCFEEIPE